MNVLMRNGSPNPNVNTSIVLREMENVFRENGVESESVFAAPGYSRLLYDRKCVFTDIANELVPKFKAA